MKLVKGNIWDNYEKPDNWVVITLNSTINKNGNLVMGAGLAKEAKIRFPGIDSIWGGYLRCLGDRLESKRFLLIEQENKKLIGIQTKYHWKDPSPLELVESSTIQLGRWARYMSDCTINCSKFGCGLGGLDWETQVRPICEAYLPDNCLVYI